MRTVTRSDRARDDIDAALDYLEQFSPAASQRLAEAIERVCRVLHNSVIGRIREEIAPGLRSATVESYQLFFVVTDTPVVVTRLIHGSRDLPTAYAE